MANLFDDCQTADLTEFYGANLLVDEEDSREPEGLYNRNTMFSESLFRTRNGFGPAFTPTEIVKSMYHWLEQQYNRLLYLTPTALVLHNLDPNVSLPDVTVPLSVAASGMTNIQSGAAIYTALFDSKGVSLGNVKVWDGTLNDSTPNVDNAFQPMFDASILVGGAANWGTFTEMHPGIITAGDHYFALVASTYNGFQTVPGPLNAGQFDPAFFTAGGGSDVVIDVAPVGVWPEFVTKLQIAMTPVDQPNRWWLISQDDGGTFTIGPRGQSSQIAHFTINIDDGSLVQGTEITDTLFNQFTGDLHCHCITSYGNRAVYIFRGPGPDRVNPVAYLLFSDPYKPQSAVLLFNQLGLPQFKDCTTGFELGGNFFALGPGWSYAWSDNLQLPESWSPPRLVSGYIGSPFIRGVCPSPDKGYAWVADKSGLFCFAGANYPVLPASYYQTPDWERINFTADANALVVKEVPSLRMVFVKVPLDGANLATHVMAWDFTRGVTPDRIKYCGLFDIKAFPFLGDIETVTSPTTKVRELYVSRGDSPGKVLRMKSTASGDATEADPQLLFDDDGAGIDALYKVLTVGAAARGKAQQYGIRVRHRGMGQTNVGAYSFDNDIPIPMAPILATEASMNPGHRYTRYVDMQSETASYEFDNGAQPGAFFIIAAIRSYFGPWMDE